MKRSRMGLILSVAMAASLLSACSGGENTAQTEKAAQAKQTQAKQEDASSEESSWPSGTITLNVPATAGGGTDMIVRVFAQAMNEVTGQNFVVVNDASGNGTVVAEKVRNEKPDGFNLFVANTGLCGYIASGAYQQSFDDFEMLGLITTPGKESNGIFVSANSEYHTLDDLIAFAKEHPGELLCGVQTSGAGHFSWLLAEKEFGITSTIVDCGGSADRITNLIGGMIDVSNLPITGASQYVESGDLRCLAIVGEQESDLIPGVKTVEELGYNKIDLPMCCVLLGPKNMMKADKEKIDSVLKIACENQTLQEGYKKMGAEWDYKTPEEAVEFVKEIQSMYDEAYKLMNN